MIKKNLWIVALIAIFAITFMGCPDGGVGGDLKNAGEAGAAEGDLVIEDAEEIAALLTAVGYYGSATTGMTVDGNIAKFDIPSGGSSDNFGFEIKFPEEAEGFSGLNVHFKLASVGNLPGGKAKIGFKSQINPSTVDVTPYPDHEVVFSGTVGDEQKQFFSLKSPNKLPNKVVYFNHNKYGDGDKKGADPAGGNVTYSLEITQLHFVAKAAEPCCKEKCVKANCKDCSEDKCEGKCGEVCCLNFNGTDATKIEFVKGATPADDKIIHHNPPVSAKEGGAAIKADGTVTMNNYSLLFYKFPTSRTEGEGKKAKEVEVNYMDYDYVEIFYTLSNIVNNAPADGTNFKVQLRNFGGADAYGTSGRGGSYQDFGTVGSRSHKFQTWDDNGTGGFAIRMNSYDTKPNAGDGTGAEFIDIKINKIEFTKGTRATVDFFTPQTPSLNNVKSLEVLVGSPIGTRIPAPKNPGWTFTGWKTGWDVGTGKPNGTTVGAATNIESSWVTGGKVKLYAEWLTGAVDPITIDNPVFTIAEGSNGGTKITYDGKNDWMLIHSAAYDISSLTSVGGADFSSYSTAGTARVSYLLNTNAQYLSEITVTYDAMLLADSSNAAIRHDSGASSSANTNNYPDMAGSDAVAGEVKTGLKLTYPISAFFGSGYFSFAKNNPGAFIVRITKIEIK